MDHESLESGDLLAVLSRATHEELKAIADAINGAPDMFITRNPRYKENEKDLTKIPEIIGGYLCRAGGNAVRNRLRGGGPEYAVVVGDVAAALRIKPLPPGIVQQEEAILKHVVELGMQGKTDAEEESLLRILLRRVRAAGGWGDKKMKGAFKPATSTLWFLPIAWDLLAGLFGGSGVAAAGEAIGVGAGAAALGPILAAVGTLFLAYQWLGPSLRATIPAVVGVAFVRQRLLWEG